MGPSLWIGTKIHDDTTWIALELEIRRLNQYLSPRKKPQSDNIGLIE